MPLTLRKLAELLKMSFRTLCCLIAFIFLTEINLQTLFLQESLEGFLLYIFMCGMYVGTLSNFCSKRSVRKSLDCVRKKFLFIFQPELLNILL